LCIITVAVLFFPVGGKADEPEIRELRTQQVGEMTYFHVRLRPPADLEAFRDEPGAPTEVRRRALARLPLLVPQDKAATAVYQRVLLRDYFPSVGFTEYTPVLIDGLEFVGKATGAKADLLLIYPRAGSGGLPRGLPTGDAPTEAEARQGWSEVKIALDFDKAKQVTGVKKSPARTPETAPARDDLEGLWAEAQAARFAALHGQTAEFGFYNIAAQATGRKYAIRAPILEGSKQTAPRLVHQQLFETMSGGSALVESLASQRMLALHMEERKHRTIPLDQVGGVRVPDHPWERMLVSRKDPEIDPTARLVPHDQYFVSFRNVPALVSFEELLELWGGNLLRALQIHDRDHELRARYEKQLCLKSAELSKTLKPGWIREVAITGTDPYLVEGTDISVILHVAERERVLAALEPYLDQARKEYGAELREAKTDYGKITIESFTTRLREVSLHRAVVGEFIVYSNSPVALRRILNVHAGDTKALADALDYRYLRTCLRRAEAPESGFMFLSDAFIRHMVSPACKIKLKRRLEARMGLALVAHGALYVAWETGRLPADHAAFLAESTIRSKELEMPEGEGAVWDGKAGAATSAVYNTLQFSTPLVELPIDRATPAEVEGYASFNREYSRLWQRYFDPAGMRYTQRGNKTQLDVLILPLVRNETYDWIRNLAGTGTTPLNLAAIPPNTVFQFLSHLNGVGFAQPAPPPPGWLIARVDDSPLFKELADVWVQMSLQHSDEEPLRQAARVAVRLPVVGGADKSHAEGFRALARLVIQGNEELKIREDESTRYKGVAIEHFRFDDESPFVRWLNARVADRKDVLKASLHYAVIDNGGYVSFSEAALHQMIDRSQQSKPAGSKVVDVGTSVYLAPGKAKRMRPLVYGVMEWETHIRALANGSCWNALYHGNLITDDMPDEKRRNTALRHLGFIPASPDGVAYRYDRHRDDVVNQRHGSLRAPRLHHSPHEEMPLARLFEQLQTFRSDLRLIGDGVRTTVLFDRKSAVQLAAEKLEPLASLVKAGADCQLDETRPGAPVVAIDLSRTPCDDAILQRLKSFPDLQEINLAATGVRDANLARLQACPRLQTLNLDGTGVTDAGLEHLYSLTDLRLLRLEADVSDEGARKLKKKLPGLTIIRSTDRQCALATLADIHGTLTGDNVDLSNTKVTDRDIGRLRLVPVGRLSARNTSITDAGVEKIVRVFPELVELDLSETSITNAALVHVARLPKLRSLYLDGTRVSDAGLPQLEKMKELRALAIETPTFSDAGARALRQAVAPLRIRRLTDQARSAAFLRTRGSVEFDEVDDNVLALDLNSGRIEDAELVHLRHFPHLKRLILHKTAITDEGLAAVAGCATLEELSLGRTQVTDASIAHVRRLPRLHTLAVPGARLTPAALKELAHLEHLQKLTVDRRFAEAENSAKHLGNLKHLRTLRVEGVNRLHPTVVSLRKALPGVDVKTYFDSDVALELIRKQGGTVRTNDRKPGRPVVEVDLSYKTVTDNELAYLGGLTEVETIDLSGTTISSTGMVYLSDLPRLRYLYLTFTKVDDAGLEHIGKLKELRWLILRDTEVTDEGLQHLQGLAKLELLNMKFTKVTAAGVRALRASVPRATILYRPGD
jgi:Leucine-rich repeat (LRR) protein